MKATLQFFNTTLGKKWAVTKTFKNAHHIDRYIDVVTSTPDKYNMSHDHDETFIDDEVDSFMYDLAQEFKLKNK
tara:strand:+ start:340 stop:561 length:222 start_codon:yes stop_codon:yes gene_type:complete